MVSLELPFRSLGTIFLCFDDVFENLFYLAIQLPLASSDHANQESAVLVKFFR